MNYNGLRNVHPQARIGENVVIDNFVTITKDVEIGDGTWIGPHVTIMDGTKIGKNCRIFPGAVVGAVPQDLKFHGEESTLEIGNNVTIREYVTLNRGTEANHRTIVGDNTLLMAYVHVAHDSVLGRNVILANSVNLGGHTEIGDYAIVGGIVGVHQFVKIGAHAMVAAGVLVRKDIPPFVKAARDPISFVGVNTVGLRRRGYSTEQINRIQEIYRIIFVRGYNTSQAIAVVESEIPESPERDIILSFVKTSKANRGLMKGLRLNNHE
jgi:UDP-N-acetylglucosamine acyltransferase